jgi:spore coat-associated protein N
MRALDGHMTLKAFRRRMAMRLAASAVLLGACALLVIGAVGPTRFKGGLKLTDSNGSIVHSNSRDGQFIFQASNMVPGGSTTGTVTLTNQDALDGDFVLTESNLVDTILGAGGASLAHQLSLKVEDITNPASSVVVYPVANPNGPTDDKLADVGTLHVATIPPGQSSTFRFTATLPNGGVPPVPSSPASGDNAYQGTAMSVEFDWTSTSISGTLFPVPGLLGMNAVRLNNGGTVTGDVSSNGQVTINNRVTVNQVVLGKGAPAPTIKNSPMPTIASRPVPFNQLAPVDPGNSAGTNANGQIQPATGISYSASTRQLSLNGATLTLSGGTYNFCSLNLNNGATLAVANGAKARIIIDSPDRSGSGCPKNSGDFSVNNNSKISNPSQDVSAMEVLVTGLNNLSSTITFNNSSAFYGAIYAPRSTVNVNNNTLFHGGLAALVVNFNNAANFEWDSAVSSLS